MHGRITVEELRERREARYRDPLEPVSEWLTIEDLEACGLRVSENVSHRASIPGGFHLRGDAIARSPSIWPALWGLKWVGRHVTLTVKQDFRERQDLRIYSTKHLREFRASAVPLIRTLTCTREQSGNERRDRSEAQFLAHRGLLCWYAERLEEL